MIEILVVLILVAGIGWLIGGHGGAKSCLRSFLGCVIAAVVLVVIAVIAVLVWAGRNASQGTVSTPVQPAAGENGLSPAPWAAGPAGQSGKAPAAEPSAAKGGPSSSQGTNEKESGSDASPDGPLAVESTFSPAQWYVLCDIGNEIRRIDLAAGSYVVIATAAGCPHVEVADYTPATHRVVYVPDGPGHRQLWLTDVDGNFQKQLTSEGENDAPRFSRDGKRIIFTHSATKVGESDSIESYEVASGKTTELVPSSEHACIGADYMPSGDGFVYAAKSGDAVTVRSVASDGTAREVGVANRSFLLRISPDGEFVAFHGNDFGPDQVERMRLSDGEKLPGPEYGLAGFCFLPDGSFLYDSGGVYRYAPTSNSSSLLITTDYGGCVLARKWRLGNSGP